MLPATPLWTRLTHPSVPFRSIRHRLRNPIAETEKTPNPDRATHVAATSHHAKSKLASPGPFTPPLQFQQRCDDDDDDDDCAIRWNSKIILCIAAPSAAQRRLLSILLSLSHTTPKSLHLRVYVRPPLAQGIVRDRRHIRKNIQLFFSLSIIWPLIGAVVQNYLNRPTRLGRRPLPSRRVFGLVWKKEKKKSPTTPQRLRISILYIFGRPVEPTRFFFPQFCNLHFNQ